MATAKAHRFTPTAVLRFSGEDHFEFLQGQGTADLRGEAGLCRYSLWLDHRGQIQGDGFVLKEGRDSMLLISYATPVEALMAKFDRHIIADDVEMENLTGAFEIVSILADRPEAVLPFIGSGPDESGRFREADSLIAYAGRRLGTGTMDVLVPGGMDLSMPVEDLNEQAAEALRIAAGVPMVPVDTAARSLNPIEANILSALSFEKGCYLGQEVVARVHRLERTSLRLVRFEAVGLAVSVAGEWVLEESVVGGVSSVVNFPDKCVGIGWLKNRCADGEWVFNGTNYRLQSVPST